MGQCGGYGDFRSEMASMFVAKFYGFIPTDIAARQVALGSRRFGAKTQMGHSAAGPDFLGNQVIDRCFRFLTDMILATQKSGRQSDVIRTWSFIHQARHHCDVRTMIFQRRQDR